MAAWDVQGGRLIGDSMMYFEFGLLGERLGLTELASALSSQCMLLELLHPRLASEDIHGFKHFIPSASVEMISVLCDFCVKTRKFGLREATIHGIVPPEHFL